jgi:hypothetical protein
MLLHNVIGHMRILLVKPHIRFRRIHGSVASMVGGAGRRLIANPARAPARLRHRAVSLPIGLLSRMVVA